MSLGQSERQRKLIVGRICRVRDNRFDDFQAKMRSDGCQNRHTAQSIARHGEIQRLETLLTPRFCEMYQSWAN